MAERRIEILVDTNATAEKLISFLTSPAVTEMLTNAGGKIEGIANLDADSLPEYVEDESSEDWEEITPPISLPMNAQESHYRKDDKNG